MKAEKASAPTSGDDESSAVVESKILSSMLPSLTTTSGLSASALDLPTTASGVTTTASGIPTTASVSKTEASNVKPVVDSTSDVKALDSVPPKRMRKKRNSSPIKKAAKSSEDGGSVHSVIGEEAKGGSVVTASEDGVGGAGVSGSGGGSSGGAGAIEAPVDSGGIEKTKVEVRKGKRRKQKKALVDGWVDPDQLADDFWKSPEKAATNMVATTSGVVAASTPRHATTPATSSTPMPQPATTPVASSTSKPSAVTASTVPDTPTPRPAMDSISATPTPRDTPASPVSSAPTPRPDTASAGSATPIPRPASASATPHSAAPPSTSSAKNSPAPKKSTTKNSDSDFVPGKSDPSKTKEHDISKTSKKNTPVVSAKKKVRKKKTNFGSNLQQELESENQQLLSLLRGRESAQSFPQPHHHHQQQQHPRQQQQHHQHPRHSSSPPMTFGGLASRLVASASTPTSSSASKGPVVRVTGRNLSAPTSAVVLNNPENAVSSNAVGSNNGKTNGSNNLSQSKSSSRSYAGPYVNERIAKGLYNRPPTHFLLNYEDTHNWRCMLCGRGNFFDDLGQLFGPFHLAESKLTNPVFASKSTVSLCCRDSFGSAPASVLSASSSSEVPMESSSPSGASPAAAAASAPRGRVVSGTKGPVAGSRSPTRSAITSSGNIAARRDPDSLTVVANPEPEPFEVWLHESCAVWSVGVYMVEGKIYGLEEALNLGAETKCSRCLENGATLGCFKSCNSNFHFPCAKKGNCQFNEDTFTIRCPKHADADARRISVAAALRTEREDKISNVSVLVR